MTADEMAAAATRAGHTPETFEEFLRGTPDVTAIKKLEQELENIDRKKKAVINDATLELRNREIEIKNQLDELKLKLSPDKS